MDLETISVDRLERGTTLTAEQYDLFVSYLNTGVKPSVTSLRNAGLVVQTPRGGNDCVSDKSKLKANRSRNYDRFNSISRRLSLRPTDGALLFKSTKRTVLPETQFEDVIKKAHTSNTKHLNISQTIQKLSRTYSMGWRQFGISEELVRDVVRSCTECKSGTFCCKQNTFSSDDVPSTKNKSGSLPKKSPGKMRKKPAVQLAAEAAILSEHKSIAPAIQPPVLPALLSEHKPITPAIQPPVLPVSGSLLAPLWNPTLRTPQPFLQQIPVAIQPLTGGDFAIKPYFNFNNYSTLQLQPGQTFTNPLNPGTVGVGNMGNSLIFGKQLITDVVNNNTCRLTWLPTMVTSPQTKGTLHTAALASTATSTDTVVTDQSISEHTSVHESQQKPTDIHNRKVLCETDDVIVVDNLGEHKTQDSFNDAAIMGDGLGRPAVLNQTKPAMHESHEVINDMSIASKPVLDMFSEEELSDIAMGTGWPDVSGENVDRITEEPMNVEDESSSTESALSIDATPNHYVPYQHVWHHLDDLESETNPYQRINIAICDMRPEIRRSLTEDRRALDWLKKKLDYVTYMVRQQKILSARYLPLSNDIP